MATPSQYATTRPIPYTTGTAGTRSATHAAAWTLPRLILVAAPVVVFVAIGLALNWNLGILAQDPVFLVMFILGIPFAVTLAFKDRPWVYLTQGILVSLMPLMVSVMFGWHVWLNPLNGVAAAGAFLFLVALLIALPTGIVAFVRTRKGQTFPALGQSVRTRSFAYTVALLALFAGFALSGTLAANNAKDSLGGGYDFDVAAIGGTSTELAIEEFQFTERTLTVTAGQVTEITVNNEDTELHTFTYEKDGVEYNHDLLGGSSASFLVLFDDVGTVLFRCVPHSSDYSDDVTSDDMVGVINVVA